MSYADLEEIKARALASWQHGGMSYNRYLETVKEANEEEERRNKAKNNPQSPRPTPTPFSPPSADDFSKYIFSKWHAEDWGILSSHAVPVITGLSSLMFLQSHIDYMTLACCFAAFKLRSKSRELTKELNEYDGFTSNEERSKMLALHAAHLGAFACLAYVLTHNVFGVTTLDKNNLMVASACCAYQLAAIGLKKAKLHVREG